MADINDFIDGKKQTVDSVIKGLYCSFAQGKWNPTDWIMVKNSAWDHFSDHWVQNRDSIENPIPQNIHPEKWETSKGDESYTSMVYKKPFRGDLTVRVSLTFSPRMAPLILFYSELGKDMAGRRELRNYTEIVFWDQGSNAWNHIYDDSTQKKVYHLSAFSEFPLSAETRHTVEVNKKGKALTIQVNGHKFGYLEHNLPEEVHLGITGCEGVCRFYDFTVIQ